MILNLLDLEKFLYSALHEKRIILIFLFSKKLMTLIRILVAPPLSKDG
jgi:hypothetical protein